MTPLSVAFLQLTDSAVLIAAKEQGFAAAEDIDLTLIRDTSWATVRDRLVYGHVQAAHILAPLAIAVTLGLSQQPCAIAVPFKLNMNGHALTMSSEFAKALDPSPAKRIVDPIATAHDFAGAIGLFRRKPVIGIVHRFSSHALTLRYWLGFAGVDPDRDITLRVVPPPLMYEALKSGEIDGFIVGEPWGSVAVHGGVGEIVAASVNIWQRGVDKVLATRADWAERNPDVLDRLIRALDRAAAWCDDPANHEALAQILADPRYVAQPAELIMPGISGKLVLRPGDAPVSVPDFMLFYREAANFPWRSQGLWIYSQMLRWKMVEPTAANERAAADVFRSDIYRRALAEAKTPMPAASLKLEGSLAEPLGVGARGALTLGPDRFFDGRVFDPHAIGAYLTSFTRR